MADREVTQSRKDDEGDIVALCNPNTSWSPRQKDDAIRDIEGRLHRYFVILRGVGRVDIHVVRGPTGKYLRTDPDRASDNNLDDLPDC